MSGERHHNDALRKPNLENLCDCPPGEQVICLRHSAHHHHDLERLVALARNAVLDEVLMALNEAGLWPDDDAKVYKVIEDMRRGS